MKEFQWKRLDKANREMALRLERLRKVHASGDKSGIGQKDRFDAKANRHRRESERGIRVLGFKHNQRVVGKRFQMSAKLFNVHASTFYNVTFSVFVEVPDGSVFFKKFTALRFVLISNSHLQQKENFTK